ncbi:unnamed protein product [Rotaria sp. Silwood2]|nr:unnamed protein product [Rotaria sp. Silwood2]
MSTFKIKNSNVLSSKPKNETCSPPSTPPFPVNFDLSNKIERQIPLKSQIIKSTSDFQIQTEQAKTRLKKIDIEAFPTKTIVQSNHNRDKVTLSVEGLQTTIKPQGIQLLKNGKIITSTQKPKISIKREDDKLLYKKQNDIHSSTQIQLEQRQPEIQEIQLEQDTFYVSDTVTLDLAFTNQPTEQPH